MYTTALSAIAAALLLAGPAQAQTATPTQSAERVAQGQRLWLQHCSECHALDRDETGPRHRGVFGRPAGSVKDYDYSRALRAARLEWNEATLERWLTDPEKFIPGQNMDVSVRDQAERAALIAYLKSLSN